jgi:hypothetical protein
MRAAAGATFFGNLTSINGASSEHDIIFALGSVETVMEASVCPMCSRALKISTIEPHPTRDGADLVTYWCPIHGDIWTSVVVNQVEAVDTEIAALLPLSRHGLFGRARSS